MSSASRSATGENSSTLKFPYIQNPCRPDDPTTFDHWEPQTQSFRLPNKDKRKWIRDTVYCERYSIADPFLMLYNPKILPNLLTVGSLVVMCGENQLEDLLLFHKRQLGNILILDPFVLLSERASKK